ncbi:MAG: asparagine synthase (glutamine-hydrolyzing) [Gemmatimonadota bacterium]|nr:asparagine synthase (glutamine-hydrolyzing) [Gemmatimonadota bacterium]
MCGIAGILSSAALEAGANSRAIDSMIELLGHRGPDARGRWCEGEVQLGHTRLSIIDLSDAGRQPLADETGRWLLIYNGEVYNYRELRRELEGKGYRFRTATDSEVVLSAYREWGPRALERFNGMWAFAVWDRERRELFGARDRAGKKPFYYATDEEGTLYFASEIKALRAVGVGTAINPQAAFDFLTQGTYGHLEGEGFFAGVRELPPAHYFLARPGEAPRLHRYWDIPVVEPRDRLPYDAGFRRRFRELVTDAVSLRLRSDVPVGATLSGGLDSSVLALCIDELTDGAPIHLFTSLYEGTPCDETPYFDAVASRLRNPVVHRVRTDEEGWRDALLNVLDHQEEPFGDTSIFAHYHLMAAARREGIPVVVSGQGGDELLMGYPGMVQAYHGHLLGTGRLVSAAREIAAWGDVTGRGASGVFRGALLHTLPLGLRDRVRARFLAGVARRVTPALRDRVTLRRFADEPGRTSFDSYIVQLFKRFSIPHLTHYDDRNAMAFSVEGRMPFLDHRLVELMFSVKYEAMYHDGVTKRVLREAFADRLPDVVRTRRDKVGFYTPLAAWMRGNAAWIGEVMAPERLLEAGVLEPERYWRRFRDLRAGDDSAELEVWRGFILHLWIQRFEVPALDGGRRRGTHAFPARQATALPATQMRVAP